MTDYEGNRQLDCDENFERLVEAQRQGTLLAMQDVARARKAQWNRETFYGWGLQGLIVVPELFEQSGNLGSRDALQARFTNLFGTFLRGSENLTRRRTYLIAVQTELPLADGVSWLVFALLVHRFLNANPLWART